jgi:hypothetical protein
MGEIGQPDKKEDSASPLVPSTSRNDAMQINEEWKSGEIRKN